MDTSTRRGRRGPTLQTAVTTAITAAAFDELAEAGWPGLSMDAVARRAGVGKAALYRRWPSKETMLTELIGDVVARNLPDVPDSGELRRDMRAFLELTAQQISDPRVTRIGLDLLAESTRNPSLAEQLRGAVAGPRRETAATILRRGVDRGELPQEIDVTLATDLMISPLLLRMILTDAPVDDEILDRMAAMIIAGAAATASL
ncbi:TetR/AcrR family transcriptional regulator [Streptomyces sp. NPDC102270]|uniref:TetR/AcrR family transcriptional regulator n=1 Tax=Streptomyces sp. NPDC102270 TaxID=3366150 RepID=UPI0037F9C235